MAENSSLGPLIFRMKNLISRGFGEVNEVEKEGLDAILQKWNSKEPLTAIEKQTIQEWNKYFKQYKNWKTTGTYEGAEEQIAEEPTIPVNSKNGSNMELNNGSNTGSVTSINNSVSGGRRKAKLTHKKRSKKNLTRSKKSRKTSAKAKKAKRTRKYSHSK